MAKIFIVILMATAFISEAAASSGFCTEAPAGRHAELKYTKFASASVEATRYEFDAVLIKAARGENELFIGAGHRYTSFDFEMLEPMTNGDLHTIYFPVHLIKPINSGIFRFAASPALSVSSNRLKNPDTIQRKDLQAWLLASYEHPLSEKMHLLLGLCADHRFGHYRAYPLAGILWKPGKKWRFRLAYPDAGIAYRPFPKLKLSFSAGPDGNEWRVYDKSMDRNSAFQYESVRLETGISWSISKAFSLGITAGKQFNNRFRLTMENNRRIATATGTISFVSMQLNLVF